MLRATQASPKPPAYRAAVARTRKNRRHALVLALATRAEDIIRASVVDNDAMLANMKAAPTKWWKLLAEDAGHPSSKPPSPEVRAAVIEKVRADLAAPYRKGRG